MSWNGKEHVLPADAMLRTIAQVEDVLSIGKIYEAMARQSLPMAKISQCYGIMLRAAGVAVSDEEVYAGMFEGDAQSVKRRAFQAIGLLQALMIPPEAIRARADKRSKAVAAKGRASSPHATGSPSGKGG